MQESNVRYAKFRITLDFRQDTDEFIFIYYDISTSVNEVTW